MVKLGLKIDGEDMDMLPGTTLELQQQNPFLQLSTEITGDYTLPFEFPVTEKNLRLTKYAAIPAANKNGISPELLIMDNDFQYGAGKLRLEKNTGNYNHLNKGRQSAYVLSNDSDFWKDIENKKLKDLDLGGERVFPNNGSISNPPAGTFLDNVRRAAAGTIDNYDYTFVPTLNNNWRSDAGLTMGLLNPIGWEATGILGVPITRVNSNPSSFLPYPYLVYIIKKIFSYAGWKVNGDILNDAQFKKAFLFTFRDIYWHQPINDLGFLWLVDPVKFDLKDHMPDVTISAFLIALKNRIGLWYDFDSKSKTCTIRYLKELLADTTKKDITAYVNPNYENTINNQPKIYNLKQEGSNGEVPDFVSVDFQGYKLTLANLPTASGALVANVWFVISENAYLICISNDGSNYFWQKWFDNTYDFLQTNATETITTAMLIPDLDNYQLSKWNGDGGPKKAQFPRIDVQGVWQGRTAADLNQSLIYICFNYGFRFQYDLGVDIICASPTPYTASGAKLGPWSLTYQFTDADGSDIGLYNRNWKKFLDTLTEKETVTFTGIMPRHEYYSLQYGQQVVVEHVAYWIKKKKTIIPFNGAFELECVRI